MVTTGTGHPVVECPHPLPNIKVTQHGRPVNVRVSHADRLLRRRCHSISHAASSQILPVSDRWTDQIWTLVEQLSSGIGVRHAQIPAGLNGGSQLLPVRPGSHATSWKEGKGCGTDPPFDGVMRNVQRECQSAGHRACPSITKDLRRSGGGSPDGARICVRWGGRRRAAAGVTPCP